MPLSKPSTDWARGIAKSLRRHLHINVIKRRLSNKVHVYAPSTGEGSPAANPPLLSKSTKKAKPPKKAKSAKKSKQEKNLHPVNSVGVQTSLPPRSFLEELSHEGNIDIMSYLEGFERNTNANNSVDFHQAQQPVTSKPRVKSSRKFVINFCILHTCTWVDIVSL